MNRQHFRSTLRLHHHRFHVNSQRNICPLAAGVRMHNVGLSLNIFHILTVENNTQKKSWQARRAPRSHRALMVLFSKLIEQLKLPDDARMMKCAARSTERKRVFKSL